MTNHCAAGTVHAYEATQAANELTRINDEQLLPDMTCTGSDDCSIIYTDPANDGGWITIELQARTLIRTIVFLANEESNESYQTDIVSVKSIGDNSDPY